MKLTCTAEDVENKLRINTRNMQMFTFSYCSYSHLGTTEGNQLFVMKNG